MMTVGPGSPFPGGLLGKKTVGTGAPVGAIDGDGIGDPDGEGPGDELGPADGDVPGELEPDGDVSAGDPDGSTASG